MPVKVAAQDEGAGVRPGSNWLDRPDALDWKRSVVYKRQVLELRQTGAFRQWRLRLRDDRARALIASRLDRLAYGHIGDAKSVGDGVSELRIHYGPGYRIYF